ncbi:hypothetical protein [Lapidilactobacillus wuchangensis]|uniref:hypothetical protein n=1 Tax=Lapidilactobacillus wuchangensis TaxID=2486001 RepID=UPI000F7B50AC|nr:hypothetical protein [Lapidilactobacillus wuchangensis]
MKLSNNRWLRAATICLMIGCLWLLSSCAKTTKKETPPRPPQQVLNDGTNVSPSIYRTDEFYQKLTKAYPGLKSLLDRDSRPDSFAIPGLDQTLTLSMGHPARLSTSRQMDPQGLAITDKYIIISAYSRDHYHHSVLYVQSKKTGLHVKTIVLPGDSHVGGLAYDPLNRRLWIATKRKHHAALAALDEANLDHDNFAKSRRAVAYDAMVLLPMLADASYLAYHDNQLSVGYFDKNAAGTLIDLPITATGQIIAPTAIATNSVRHFYTEKDIQGISYYKNYLIFSQSYGAQDSKLLVFKNPDNHGDIDLDRDEVIASVNLPPYLEQIKTIGPDIYLLFESASLRYRDTFKGFHADHVFKIKFAELLKQGTSATTKNQRQ